VIAGIGALIAAALYFVNDWTAVWEKVKSVVVGAVEFIVNLLTPVFEMIGRLMQMGGSLGSSIGGFFGASGNGGLNHGAVDRYNGVQASTGFQASATPGGGGGVTIQSMTVVSNDPRAASRDIAENLYNAMLGSGVSFA
jgi:hypothetical protein